MLDLLSDSFDSSEHAAPNGWMITKSWIGKNVVGSGRGLILGTISGFSWRDKKFQSI
jgi:hypothetical protein